MESNCNAPPVEGEFSLKQVFGVLLNHKSLIISFTVFCTLVAGSAAWILPKKYEAIIVVAPVASNSSGGESSALGSLASQFGGLASLAGISGSGDSKKAESVAVLQSEALTEKYIRQNNLLPQLFAKQWDPKRSDWKVRDANETPSLWKANQLFKKNIRVIAADLKTGLVTLTIKWTDPATAANWANGLVALTNEYLRDKAIKESERNIAYLSDEAAKTNVIEVRHAIFSILENELNKSMLARGNTEYAFKIIDPASVPEKPSSPQKLGWLLGGMFCGLFLSTTAVLIRWSWGLA